MAEILDIVRSRAGTGYLAFWGSSMGGYAAILHGDRLGAGFVYANVPQTHLYNTTFGVRNKNFFDSIFSDKETIYNNLIDCIRVRRSHLTFFLCFNVLESGNYFAEQGLPFIGHLDSLKWPFYAELRPEKKYCKNHGIGESISLFKKFSV